MKKRDLIKLMEEAYIEVLLEQDEEPQPEDPKGDETASTEAVLPDATDTMLEKFPTLKKSLTKLMTKDYKEFVKTIDWVSPRPTEFRINLQNDQDFTLKWSGKNFQATIQGKKYFLGTVDEFQQALDKLAILYKTAPIQGAEEEGGADDPFAAGGGGGGEFPGGEGGAPGEDAFDETPPAEDVPLGDEAGEPEDLSGEDVDFEKGDEPL